MSMWDFNDEGDQDRQYRDPYASHSGSSDYYGGYSDHQSHIDHSDHNHGHDQHHNHGHDQLHSHVHSHSQHADSYSYHGQRSGGGPSQENYGSRHESYAHDYQGYGHDSSGNQRHDRGHELYVSPSLSSNSVQSPTPQPAHHGGGHQSYNMSAGYEILEEHRTPPPPSTTRGNDATSRDLFTSDSVVNLTLDEIDALARTRRSRSWLVVLYAPWCRFCQVMEPNFERVAHHLEQSNVYVGRFRADGDYKEYAKRYLQLEHFPTVLFFPKDSSHIVKYQSENREVDALLGFVHAFE